MNARITGLILLGAGVVFGQTAPSSNPTFSKDVLPILQKNCQSCHRPGQVAPMSFLDYESVRPWAKAMKLAVVTGKMPPWFADPNFNHFANDRSLSRSDIDTISKWADGGALEGNPRDAPPAVNWPATKLLNAEFNPEVDGFESFVMNDGSTCAWVPGQFRYVAK